MADAPPRAVCLTVWTFETPLGAEAALARLEPLADEGRLVLDDAALVTWPRGRRKPSTRSLGCLTGPGALWGGFWGVLLGLVFLVPLAGPTFGAAAGAFAGSLADFGIGDGFVKRVRDSVTPGSSALFVLCDGVAARALHAAMDDLDAGLIRTDLSEDQERSLRLVLGEESEAAESGAAYRHARQSAGA